MKIVTAIKRARHIIFNLIDLVGSVAIFTALMYGFSSMVIAALMIADAPITAENVTVVLEHVPISWLFVFAILYSLHRLIFTNILDFDSWKLAPKQTDEQELPTIGKEPA